MFLIGPIDADKAATFGLSGCSETDSFIFEPFHKRWGAVLVVRAARDGGEFLIARRNRLRDDSSSSEYSLPGSSTTARFESLVEFIFSEKDDNS